MLADILLARAPSHAGWAARATVFDASRDGLMQNQETPPRRLGWTPAWLSSLKAPIARSVPTGDKLLRNVHHPADAKLVFQHAELRRPECLGQRHLHFSAFTQRRENAVGFCFGFRRDGKGEALEVRRPGAPAVRSHDRRISDAKTAVHDFVGIDLSATASLLPFLRGLRGVFKAHEHLDFRAEGLAVELKGLFATAVEKEVGLNGGLGLCAHLVLQVVRTHDERMRRVWTFGCTFPCKDWTNRLALGQWGMGPMKIWGPSDFAQRVLTSQVTRHHH